MEVATEVSKIVIDPDGDVIFVLAGTELQVSSKVLSLTSSVFRAMFGPKFLEGQSLSAASPKRVSFPEDDAATMTTLCNILHHQSQNVIKEPDHTTVLKIGILCDKYDCSHALQPWSGTWLGHYQRGLSAETSGLTQLLFPFYVFNDVASFKEVSRIVVYYTKGFLSRPAMTGSLPDAILGKLASGLSLTGFPNLTDTADTLQRKKWEVECQLSSDLTTMLESNLDRL